METNHASVLILFLGHIGAMNVQLKYFVLHQERPTMVVAIDIDDTLFCNHMVPNIIKEYGLNIQHHSWDMHELGDNVLNVLYRRFLMPSFMCRLSPFDGSVERVKEWHDAGHKIICITARHPHIRTTTTRMVQKHFPFITDVHFAKEFRGTMHEPEMDNGKNAALSQTNSSVIIDDASHNIEASLIFPNMKRFLISNEGTSYNWDFVKKVASEGLPVTVVKSITEVVI